MPPRMFGRPLGQSHLKKQIRGAAAKMAFAVIRHFADEDDIAYWPPYEGRNGGRVCRCWP
jgi:hypothetical protein